MMANSTPPNLFSRLLSRAQVERKGVRDARAVRQLWYLLAAVIGFLTIVNWSMRLYRLLRKPRRAHSNESLQEKDTAEASTPGKTGRSSLRRLPLAVTSLFRVLAFRTTVPIGPSSVMSVTEVAFILAYIIALLVWLWINTEDMDPTYFRDRAAHLASCQVPLIVALAGKNNIISFLTGVSHEKLNVLHRASGRACLVLMWIHALIRGIPGLPERFDLSHEWMRWGVVSLAAFSLATLLSIRPIRTKFFEFFLISHMVLIFIFTLGGLLHAGPRGFGDYFWPAFLVWGLDRVIRIGRLVWNNRIWSRTSPDAHHASIELLTSDTVKLTLRRKMHWAAGQHAYILLPSVSKLPTEAHPFTIASIPHSITGLDESPEKEVVFLIRTQNGFTDRLREHASTKGKSSSIPAYIDGPYGSAPDLRNFSTCILIAGGSGISYTLPLFLDIIRNARSGTTLCQRVLFVWIVRHEDYMNWISKPLTDALLAAPTNLAIEPRIFFTRPKTKSSDTLVTELNAELASPCSMTSSDTVMTMKTLAQGSGSIKTANGRPDVEALIQDAVSLSTGPVSVDVAGPSSLASVVRAATSFENTNPIDILKGRPTVTLHMETFGMVKA